VKAPEVNNSARKLVRILDLRFKRLMQHLRSRAPDANVGYSILIYRLGEDELREVFRFSP